jgi:hypothetical protein
LRKLIFILSTFIIVAGCSITKRGISNYESPSEQTVNESIISDIENQNLTNRNFFIQKAEIEIEKEGESESFIASVKYDISGNYLISLKGKTGIEAARIYITKDTILVNDRINRNLLFGKPGYIDKRLGIPMALLPLVFGDFISDGNKGDTSSPCTDGTLYLEHNVIGVNIRYAVDCKKRKVKSALRTGSMNSEIAEFMYDKFINYSGGSLPSGIHINYMDSRIYIKIIKFEIPWDGLIEFIPGSKYEKIELL